MENFTMSNLKYLILAVGLTLGAAAVSVSTNVEAAAVPVATGYSQQAGLVQNVAWRCHWVNRCTHRHHWSGRMCRKVRICR
jgi:hypothetical protein